MSKVQTTTDKDSFEAEVKKHFSFLETEFAMAFSGVREMTGDPRDNGILASYNNDQLRAQIGWSEAELSLIVTIRLKRADVLREKRWIYFEPFIEFVTKGACCPIVPQIYYRMSGRATAMAVKERSVLFRNGTSEVLVAVAQRLRSHLNDVIEASSDVIIEFHKWFALGGGSQV